MIESSIQYNNYLANHKSVTTGLYYCKQFIIERVPSLPTVPHIISLKDDPVTKSQMASKAYNDELFVDRIEIEEIPLGITIGISYHKATDKIRLIHSLRDMFKGNESEFQNVLSLLAMKHKDIAEHVGSNKILYLKWATSKHKELYDKLPMLTGIALFDTNRTKYLSVLRRDSVLRSIRLTSGGLVAGGTLLSMDTVIHSLIQRKSCFSTNPMPIAEIYVSKSNNGEIKLHGRAQNYEYDILKGGEGHAKNYF